MLSGVLENSDRGQRGEETVKQFEAKNNELRAWVGGEMEKLQGRKEKEDLLAQVHVPVAQRGQTHQNVGVWSRGSFIAGLCKETGLLTP